MRQRQLRLGDVLDDYCPRERRITNHAVVAMVEGQVKQTRCTTCHHEHVYKEARIPARPKRGSASALYKEVLSSLGEAVPTATKPSEGAETNQVSHAEETIPTTTSLDSLESKRQHEPPSTTERDEEGPVHRPLIRATLPRKDGEPRNAPARPDFTIYQQGARGGPFRGGSAPHGRPAGGSSFSHRSGGARSSGGQPSAGGPAHRRHRSFEGPALGNRPARSDQRGRPPNKPSTPPSTAPGRSGRMARHAKKRSR